ncbi:MAG: long-chain fatty acid--CoA ligase [Kordiimonadaceae bacterium]|nr:long-chain fatty acid--CoA ligase [Kordiimonadaceae bacterium]MBO6568234.1 long-chain fatty acid--CoA ligase [Kordiimonadaceae bacterium]MBO6964036.1 long-chain fatty acid--CoA ligase [Kordiimonadaceae bacterium]
MATKSWNSLTHMFFEQALTLKDKPLLFAKNGDSWKSQNWTEVAEQVTRLGAALRAMGVDKGDRVVIVSENRPEWMIADFAIMAIGAISVPTYTTNTVRDHLHIIENSGAKAAIVSTKNLTRTFLRAAHQCDEMQHAIVMEPVALEQQLNVTVYNWDDVINAEKADIVGFRDGCVDVTRDDIACIIYTSGTGGSPKGVMLHHGSLMHNAEGASKVIKPLGLENNAFLSFLPLSHAYEHTTGLCWPLMIGAEIWYAESIEKLATNMAESKPTIMVVVPRLFEMLRTRITRGVQAEGGMKAKLFERAIALGFKVQRDNEKLSFFEKIEDWFLNMTVRKKVRKQFGGRLKALVSGGAPLSPDVGFFFASLGLPLLQGYGQTEAGPVISVNPPWAPKMHTVGQLFDKIDAKIADDGEILVKGELVMKGYWRNDDATAEAIKDGWLHTGDIGHFDDQGYLEITDRKKDIIVNDKGDNVSPQRVEGLLALEDEIAQAMIYGDKRPHMVALIVPDAEWLVGWAKSTGKSSARLEKLADDKDLHRAIDEAVSRINKRLSNIEKVRKFALADEAFTIENAQMTPSLKLRRHVVKEVYKEKLEAMY